jgi:hypothetical protein
VLAHIEAERQRDVEATLATLRFALDVQQQLLGAVGVLSAALARRGAGDAVTRRAIGLSPSYAVGPLLRRRRADDEHGHAHRL